MSVSRVEIYASEKPIVQIEKANVQDLLLFKLSDTSFKVIIINSNSVDEHRYYKINDEWVGKKWKDVLKDVSNWPTTDAWSTEKKGISVKYKNSKLFLSKNGDLIIQKAENFYKVTSVRFTEKLVNLSTYSAVYPNKANLTLSFTLTKGDLDTIKFAKYKWNEDATVNSYYTSYAESCPEK